MENETYDTNGEESLGSAVLRAVVVSAATVVATYASIAAVGLTFHVIEKRREKKNQKTE